MHDEHLDYTKNNMQKTFIIIIVTVITMICEILFGYTTKSMSLLADGYHMGTHAIAFGLTFIAYLLVEKFKNSELFPNGTDKIGYLAAYTSSLILGITGITVIYEAITRIIFPVNIQFNEAIFVAILGLIINAVSIFILESGDEHEHHEDINFMSAYYHILSDILTSVLAIFALVIGKYTNIVYFDAIIGIFGGILIIKWTINLLKESTTKLIDMKHQNKK